MQKLFGIMRSKVTLPGLLLAGIAASELALVQFPPAIMADRYLVQAERELAGGDPGAAVEPLNRIVALQAEHGLETPKAFWFKRAKTAHEARLLDLVIESVVRYVEITGQGGEHYVAALELYDAAELTMAQAAELARAAAAEPRRR